MAPPSKTTLNENRISDHGEVHFLASSEYGMPPSTTDARVRKPMLGLGHHRMPSLQPYGSASLPTDDIPEKAVRSGSVGRELNAVLVS